MDWQTIESAPKTCRILLHGFGPDGLRHIVTEDWDLDKYGKKHVPHFSCTEIDSALGKRYLRAIRWTHWAPLTPPEGT